MSLELPIAEADDGLLPLDRHFGELLDQFAGASSEWVKWAAMLVSRWTRDGHTCLDLNAVAGTTLSELGIETPPLATWREALLASPVVAEPGQWAPLILDGNRLYLYRYWAYECRLAEALNARVQARMPVDQERLKADVATLFPPPGAEVDWQKLAAAAAVLRQFCVVSGGPGTGKTHTVVRILALLVGQIRPNR
ncbi:AAA family ATPase [Alkalilimnicola ehrlichii]|uniref:AAA family ATPase n=1 Tax=Alkalilimnicola ehrlichii TaxID=351052 RepID=UPI000E2F7E99|nr:AAA family ATPase [Alkalilimnicola ehrlichii]